MKNKKTFFSIIFGLVIYMILSWIISAGNFSNTTYENVGFNQLGLFDIVLAPINLFNYYVVSMTKNINGLVNQFSYGNIVLAFVSIGIFYGVLNGTGVYTKLINDIKTKLENKKILFTMLIAFFYMLYSSLTGLYLVLFFLLPLVSAVMYKLKIAKLTTFASTIGAMLLGTIGSLYNPNINGLNRILVGVSINNSILPRIIFFVMLLILLLTFVFLNYKEEESDSINLLNEEENDKKIRGKKKVEEINKSYIPIIITISSIVVILTVCMYNWYYMFSSTSITNGYNNLINTNIKDYAFMKNILGLSEAFGYWTGFTMSALLIISSLIVSFLYSIKIDKIFDNMKKGFIDMIPTLFYSILSLSLIVISLHNSNSFIYSFINRILLVKNQIFGVLLSSFVHNICINDYFALLSSLIGIFSKTYGTESINLTLLSTQIGHGISGLITPFNIYLIAGLSFLNIPYTKWIKFIWKFLLILIVLSIIILLIVSSFD